VTSSVKQNKITGGECVGVLPFDGEIKMYIITDITWDFETLLLNVYL